MTLRNEHPVERAVRRWWLEAGESPIVVAVSGGADSMALVEALRQTMPVATKSRDDKSRLRIAHLNHTLRDDSGRDAAHVADYANRHGLVSSRKTRNVAAIARAEGLSVEEAGRNERYKYFAAAAIVHRTKLVLTGHTQDDQIETVLMRIVRGTGQAGLAGIPNRRGIFARPLLNLTRHDTVDYCRLREVEFVNDPSNADTKYFRNRVRHEILPELRAVYPGIDAALLRIAANARRDQQRFADYTDDWHRALVTVEGDELAVRTGGVDDMDRETVERFLHDVCARNGWSRDLDRSHYARLAGLFRNSRPGASADLPGFSARREHDAVVLSRLGFRPRPVLESHALVVPGTMRVGKKWILETDFVSLEEARRAIASGQAGGAVAYFDADAVGEDLVVGPPRPGDRMRPLGMAGHKKLSDIFIDRKVPRRYRDATFLIRKDETVHWVLGLGISEESRVGPGTQRVLRVKVKPA